ncbi:MAG: RNA-binding transcriptional accessory protein [Candidatus Kuenenia sp.]|nr:RNA-binding transcriptional accessory protein [Candidatus Kuenenia hertensis]
MDTNCKKTAQELSLSEKQVSAVITLLDEGGTIPFIARYRKEMTGSLDEVAILAIRDRVAQLRELDKRRETILNSLIKQEKLTPELEKAVNEAETLAVLEDIYLPYKPKRKTRATAAKEKGLEPLAKMIFEQKDFDLHAEAVKYIDAEKGVNTEEETLQGARDIIAEWINEDADARKEMRELFLKEGILTSEVIKGKEEEAQKYKDYFEWKEPVASVPSHRMLAMRRGEKEQFLLLNIAPPQEQAIDLLKRKYLISDNGISAQVEIALKDAYKRLLSLSMETEIRLNTKKEADEEAIRVFAKNLRQLLLASPLGQKTILAIDPGFRTGCKVVCLDKQGKLLHNETIFPHDPQRKTLESSAAIKNLCKKYEVEAIAIGNGTASRETESFVNGIDLPNSIITVMVNESGASVYSASGVAREEFPDHDVTVRGAVSIGRRLADPLAELVKIDPKAIGVGQYQHDVDQTALKQSLDDVVMSCVNSVGVELNTASRELLSYVSGLGPQLAKKIVEYRNEHGPFKSRAELIKVPRLGDKAFEQAAGFLRIRDGENPLDSSAVHPESYYIVEKMARDLNCGIEDLIKTSLFRSKIDLKKYVTEEIGLPTLNDILNELDKPGRDPREKYEAFAFAEGINAIEDLETGMTLPGIVTNITNFGAFVDIGVHQDGLVHISNMADKFVKNPADVVSVQQKVMVTVIEVDRGRRRISLSMKSDPFGKEDSTDKKPKKRDKEKAPELVGDLQAQLAMLKAKFNG